MSGDERLLGPAKSAKSSEISAATSADVAAVADALPSSTKSYTVCTSCNESLPVADYKAHYKSDRHQYNVKRKTEGLLPIPADLWEKKLQRFEEIKKQQAVKKTDHLKARKTKEKPGAKRSSASGSAEADEEEAAEEADRSFHKVEEEEAIRELLEEDEEEKKEEQQQHTKQDQQKKKNVKKTGCHSLFDDREFQTVPDCLNYMRSKYSFFLPEKEYCCDVEGLLKFLHRKIQKLHRCLYCDREFETEAACRRHMRDKNHTRIGTEG
jgi:pre-60S factor REI1